MRIAAVSDLHGHLPEVPPCDILILAGDLCPATNHDVAVQSGWLGGPFREWLEGVPAKTTVAVAGNHDFVFQRAPGLVPRDLPWVYLQDSGAVVEGLRFWGTPWQPVFFDWAFNATEADRRQKWSLIPVRTQVLVLHGPPHGFGDLVPRMPRRGDDDRVWPGREHAGCRELRERLDELPDLRLAVFGHIHSGHGVYRLPGRVLANVAHVDEEYKPRHPVTVFDVPDPGAGDWWPPQQDGGRP